LTLREATGLISLIMRHAKLIELVDLEKRVKQGERGLKPPLNADEKCERAEPRATYPPLDLLWEQRQAWRRAAAEFDPKPK
jgi:hypothetical protein